MSQAEVPYHARFFADGVEREPAAEILILSEVEGSRASMLLAAGPVSRILSAAPCADMVGFPTQPTFSDVWDSTDQNKERQDGHSSGPHITARL